MQDCVYSSQIPCSIRTCSMYITSGSEVDTILQESGNLLVNIMLAYLITVYPPETFVHDYLKRENIFIAFVDSPIIPNININNFYKFEVLATLH